MAVLPVKAVVVAGPLAPDTVKSTQAIIPLG